MVVYLKSVAALLGLLGVLAGLRFTFRVAQAGHLFLVYSAVGSFLTALVGGSLLWGVGALHAKLDRGG